MLDTSTSGSPGWWLQRLGDRLRTFIPVVDVLERYYVGDHPLPVGDRSRSRLYRELQKRARSNYTGLVVESVKERLHVDGFSSGGTDTQDAAAWAIWQANGLDADSAIAHQTALFAGRSYAIVGPDPNASNSNPGTPLITVEDPRQVIHESMPTNRREVAAALKMWEDEIVGVQKAVVYLPDGIYYFTGPPVAKATPKQQRLSWQSWFPTVSDALPDGQAENPIGVVPVVPFLNRPRLRPSGYETLGEFQDVLDVQDRINGMLLDRLVISRMQAYRQRYMTGATIEKDENGNPKRPFDPDATSLWVALDENTKFGDFAQADLAPLLAAISADVTDLAAITRTPPQYLLGQMVNLSGDALEAAQAGLVSKVRERQRGFGESWEQVIRLASRWTGGNVGDDAQVIWADPTQRSLVDTSNAAVALQTAGVPWRSRMTAIGYTPADIARMEAEQMQDSLRARMLAPVPTTVTLTETDALGTPGATPAPNGTPVAVPAAAPPPTEEAP